MRTVIRSLSPWFVAVLLLGAVGGFASECRSAASVPVEREQAGAGIQSLIDQAGEGDVITIPAGAYEERVVVDKPLRLVAVGEVLLIGNEDAPVLHVAADDVAVEGLRIVQQAEAGQPAVRVSASRASLRGLDIRTRASGIQLRGSHRSELVGNTIRPFAEDGESMAGMDRSHNGIDAFESHDNLLEANDIAYMNDGIYLESSDRNVVRRNRVDHSRYGIHGMFSAGVVIAENVGEANTTGAMVMGVEGAEVVSNTFVKMSESVHSQGILLFEVHGSRIADNRVEGNRVGLYVELSSGNEIRDNRIIRNFVGIQLLESERNRLEGNDAIGNVVDVEAADSRNNRITRNYWDAYRGIDSDGDGGGDFRYAIHPFFRKLVTETPAYQLFFHSPGMQFLESMFASGQADWTFDDEPLMAPSNLHEQDRAAGAGGIALAASSVMLIASLMLLFYYGGRRR